MLVASRLFAVLQSQIQFYGCAWKLTKRGCEDALTQDKKPFAGFTFDLVNVSFNAHRR
jgi:hypothetical protein